MSPIQQMLLGVGAVAKKTYVDDVFSTYLYAGNSASQSINNGIDLAGEGGMVWAKRRSGSQNHILADTVRGITKYLNPNDTAAEVTDQERFLSVSSTGFAVGDEVDTNGSSSTYASWSFRKAPGFFDVKTWDGNSTAGRQISHDLGCVPGLIMVKSTNNTGDWMVYHRGVGNEYRLKLNSFTDKGSGTASWNDTTPTSTYVELGGNTGVNATGTSYVGYFFAGGESSAATARSVSFNGSSAYLSVPDTNGGWDMGTGAFTIETWFRYDGSSTTSTNDTLLDGRNGTTDYAYYFHVSNAGKVKFTHNAGNFADTVILEGTTVTSPGLWYHAAVSKSGNTIKLFVNGIEEDTASDTKTYNMGSPNIGWRGTGAVGSSLTYWNGLISNFRVVKGTAVYTSSFKPPTEPLTNITNTSLLFCNDSSVTGSTVTTGTITSTGSPTASTDSPFDDPAGFVFGDAGDQGIIKCGSYVGNNTSNGPEIYLGWEPQWVLVKTLASGTINKPGNWRLLDSMRGIVTGGADPELEPNSNSSEDTGNNRIAATPTGFKIDTASSSHNDNNEYIYVAIRRSDGYVGKPPELGTGVFAMDTGNSSSTIPCFDSNFAVDFALITKPATTLSNYVAARLFSGKELITDGTGAEGTAGNNTFDSNAGWRKGGADSTFQSWMWKRHAGFDCIAFQGSSSDPGPSYAHGLGKIPELKIIKRRNASSTGWITTGTVVSQAIAGNNNSKDYYLYLNTDAAATNFSNYWSGNDTSTHFTVRHGNGEAGGSADPYLCLLFASVDGISKVGSYTGNGQNWHGIEVGFAPRFYMIKKVSGTGDWFIVDNTRGLDENLLINETDAQAGPQHIGTPSSTTWYIGASGSTSILNTNNEKYIYYVHA